jgi:hypothetical protein
MEAFSQSDSKTSQFSSQRTLKQNPFHKGQFASRDICLQEELPLI